MRRSYKSTGRFTSRAYCTICRKQTLEIPSDTLEKSTVLPLKYIACSQECFGEYIERVWRIYSRICKRDTSVKTGVQFMLDNASLPNEIASLIANLEFDYERATGKKFLSRSTRR